MTSTIKKTTDIDTKPSYDSLRDGPATRRALHEIWPFQSYT